MKARQPHYRTHVFVSYSHKDKEWLERLREVFGADIRNDRIGYWDDRELQPGDPWYDEIFNAIDHARVAILLVSPNFLASQFIMEEEWPRILEAVDDGLTVLWLPLSGTFYGPDAPDALKPITGIQAAIPVEVPLDEQSEESLSGTLLDLCKRVQKVLNPSTIPPNLPFQTIGRLFKGREKEFAHLEAELREIGARAIFQAQAISGMGGVGKTRLAVEYAWRHQSDFSALLFVSANTPANLDTNLALLSGVLDLPEAQGGKQDQQYAAVIRWLQQNKGWLLILDNVDTLEGVGAVKALIKSLPGGQVLITSRITGPKWGNAVRRLRLDKIELDDAEAYLLEATEDERPPQSEDRQQARALAEVLDCLPLALTHAQAYVREHYKSFAHYQSDFETRFSETIAWFDHDSIEYDPNAVAVTTDPEQTARLRTVATTFFMSFDRLGSTEKALLRAASFLAPDPVPVAMFEDCPEETKALVELWCAETGETPDDLTVPGAVAGLARYSLVTRSEGALSVHPMEQAVVRNSVPKERRAKWIESTRAALLKYAPNEIAENPATWLVWDMLRPHAEKLVALVDRNPDIKPNLTLLSSLGALYYGKGLYERGLDLDKKSLALAEALHGPESDRVAGRSLCLGETLRVLGRYAEAEEAFRRSLCIREALHGAESASAASVLNYLAIALRNQGQVEEAEALYRRALSIYDSLGKDADMHDLSRTLNNLGRLLSGGGSKDEAKELLERALAIMRAELGSKHPHTLININNLARLHEELGDHEAAQLLCEQALEGFEAELGSEHPLTLMSVSILASLYESRGDYAAARPLYERVLEARERVLGPEHEDTLASVNNLAVLRESQGDYAAAQPLFERVLKAKERANQIANQGFVLDLNRYAILLRKLAHFDDAAESLRRAIEIEDRLLSADHPKRPHRRNNLAVVLMLAGKTEEASQVNAEAWEIKSTVSEGRHDVTSARILFVRIALDCLTSSAPNRISLGQLRTLLELPELPCYGGIEPKWDPEDVLAKLRGKLPPEQAELLASLVEAMNDRAKLTDLDRFEIWRNQVPVSL